MEKINFKLAGIKFPFEKQIEKVHEEFLELSSAASSDERLEEAFDLLQATATLINGFPAQKVREFKKKHLLKMEKYLKNGRIKPQSAAYSSLEIKKIANKIICNKKKYRPFENGAELMGYYKALFSFHHGTPAVWVVNNETGWECLITAISLHRVVLANGDCMNFKELAENYSFPLSPTRPAAKYLGDA